MGRVGRVEDRVDRIDREWEVKLKLMGAVARSQEALADILESIAEVTGNPVVLGSLSVDTLQEHVRALTGMQGALLKTVTGHCWQPPVRGVPCPPWLAEDVRVDCAGAQEVQHAGGGLT